MAKITKVGSGMFIQNVRVKTPHGTFRGDIVSHYSWGEDYTATVRGAKNMTAGMLAYAKSAIVLAAKSIYRKSWEDDNLASSLAELKLSENDDT